MKMTLDQRAPQIKMAGGIKAAQRGKLYDKLKAEREAKLSKKKAGVPAQKTGRKLKTQKPLIRIHGRKS